MLLFLWVVVVGTRGVPGRPVLLSVTTLVLLISPISEELWIAWNFGKECKTAGTFIHKKIAVDGFYDDTRTTHAGPPTLQAIESFEQSGYRFLEMRGREKFIRIEKLGDQWRPVVLDKPSAKYEYKSRSHIPTALKVVKHESTVLDRETGEVLAQELIFGRYAPWFFVGLDSPIKLCYGKRDVNGLLYTNALPPKRRAL